MAMRDYPCSGFVLPLEKLKELLPADKQEEFKTLLGALDADKDVNDALREFVYNNASVTIKDFDLFILNELDNTLDENMEPYVYYARLHTSDLYVMTETPALTAMKKLGIEPKFCNWSHYG